MNILGHKLAFAWGFSLLLFFILITLVSKGSDIPTGVAVVVLSANLILTPMTLIQRAKEKQLLDD